VNGTTGSMVLICGIVLAFVAWGAAERWGEATDAHSQQTATPPAVDNTPSPKTRTSAPSGGLAQTDRTPHADGGSGNRNPVTGPSDNTATKP
jgi:hypothetical protein